MTEQDIYEFLKTYLYLDDYSDWDGEKGVCLKLINPSGGPDIQLGYKVTTEKSSYDG